MKRILSILAVFVLALGICAKPVSVYADGESQTCKSLYLCTEDGYEIMKSNENKRLPIASMCKIMTLLLSFEAYDDGLFKLDDKICVSENSSGMGGSQVYLESGYSYTVSDLIKSITVASANDACVAMAERISGSENAFIDKMNEKAKQLNMENTHFVNCTGLPKSGQYSSAKDVSVMFRELIKHKEYFNYSKIWMDEIHHKNDRITSISNTNKLVKFYKGCDGGKTGFTSEAGFCLCATAERDGLRLISVVIASPDSKTRFKEISKSFDYGFETFEAKKLLRKDEPLNIFVDIEKAKNEPDIYIQNDINVCMKKGEKKSFEIKFVPSDNLTAPLKKDSYVGEVQVLENGSVIKTEKAYLCEDAEKCTLRDYISKIVKFF